MLRLLHSSQLQRNPTVYFSQAVENTSSLIIFGIKNQYGNQKNDNSVFMEDSFYLTDDVVLILDNNRKDSG